MRSKGSNWCCICEGRVEQNLRDVVWEPVQQPQGELSVIHHQNIVINQNHNGSPYRT